MGGGWWIKSSAHQEMGFGFLAISLQNILMAMCDKFQY